LFRSLRAGEHPFLDQSKMTAKQETALQHIISGAGAGLLSDAVVHPLDTIRVRMQMDGEKTKFRTGTSTFLHVLRNEGIPAFYKGFSAVATGTIPGHALYFYGYEQSKKILNSTRFGKENTFLVHFSSGLIADVFGSFAWCPMDVVKQRLQVQIKGEIGSFKQRYQGSVDAIRVIVKQDGFRGLYRGYWAGLATYGPYVALYFSMYEELKTQWKKYGRYKSEDELPFYSYLISAGFAGGSSAIVTVPLDVIKTRLQINAEGIKYKNAFDAFGRILREEGAKTFFRGWQPRCLWMGGGTATTMMFYEVLKKFNKSIL
jgi:hypothetical protein